MVGSLAACLKTYGLVQDPLKLGRGFCFPKDISVMGKDLYNSLRLQKQSHLVSNTYVIFFILFYHW